MKRGNRLRVALSASRAAGVILDVDIAVNRAELGERYQRSVIGHAVALVGDGYARALRLPLWAWLLPVGVIYAIFLRLCAHGEPGLSTTPYYNYLLDAFLHGRTDLVGSGTYDLSHFNGKWYMYWGPSPVLFIGPFYVISHLRASDVLYGCVAGFLNVAVFAGCVSEFVRYFRLPVSKLSQVIVLLSFAFASPNFYLSLGGTVWFVDQLVAILYLGLYLFFLLKFLNDRRYVDLVLAAVFFSLSWNARLSLIFYGLLFLYGFGVLYRERSILLPRAIKTVALISAISFAAFCAYNAMRFFNPLEFGYTYQIPAARFAADFAAKRMFSLSHVPHNATYYFLNAVRFQFEKPYVQIDQEGNSIFSVYPLVLLGFYFLSKSTYNRVNRWFVGVLGLALLIDFSVILMNLGTGWVQFGSRYFFDLVPGLFLLVLFVADRVPPIPRSLLLLYGMLVNFAGVLLYFNVIHWT